MYENLFLFVMGSILSLEKRDSSDFVLLKYLCSISLSLFIFHFDHFIATSDRIHVLDSNHIDYGFIIIFGQFLLARNLLKSQHIKMSLLLKFLRQIFSHSKFFFIMFPAHKFPLTQRHFIMFPAKRTNHTQHRSGYFKHPFQNIKIAQIRDINQIGPTKFCSLYSLDIKSRNWYISIPSSIIEWSIIKHFIKLPTLSKKYLQKSSINNSYYLKIKSKSKQISEEPQQEITVSENELLESDDEYVYELSEEENTPLTFTAYKRVDRKIHPVSTSFPPEWLVK